MPTSASARTYNQNHVPRKYTPGKRRISIYWTWSYPWEAQRDPAEMENRFSTMTEVRNVRVAGLRDAGMERGAIPPGHRRHAGVVPPLHAQLSERSRASRPAIPSRSSSASIRPGYKLPIDERILADTDTLMVFGLDHLLSEQEAAPEEIAAIRRMAEARGHLPVAGAASRRGLHERSEAASDGIPPPPRPAGAAPAALRPVHALADEGARRSRAQHLRASARHRAGHRTRLRR